ncbi:hypothetical protein KY290_016696 [Solanum tuberosum]|uniref:Uncharacterized protein n=1 Tax=Solanum tuberosum TaxID=4113 RepID=A0ABQ7V956_SOLTU|nr:hypothetical protein KY284_015978 [Solanum tuberosum]KAH0760623.1 hypothetical protein KY290_016696 [Solanum tuberosum]
MMQTQDEGSLGDQQWFLSASHVQGVDSGRDTLYKRSQNEQRDFDKRVEIEVQKVTSTLKIEMEEKLFKAKEDIKVMDKKLLKAEEGMEMMKKKLSEANY